jgi:hypothetical protein
VKRILILSVIVYALLVGCQQAPSGTYVGEFSGHAAIGIAVADGKAMAYVCDSQTISEWFKGDISGSTLDLTSKSGVRLQATFVGNSASGTLTLADGKSFPFTAELATGNAGFYRAETSLEGSPVVGGWIILPDGRQAGALEGDTPVLRRLPVVDSPPPAPVDSAPAPVDSAPAPVAERTFNGFDDSSGGGSGQESPGGGGGQESPGGGSGQESPGGGGGQESPGGGSGQESPGGGGGSGQENPGGGGSGQETPGGGGQETSAPAATEASPPAATRAPSGNTGGSRIPTLTPTPTPTATSSDAYGYATPTESDYGYPTPTVSSTDAYQTVRTHVPAPAYDSAVRTITIPYYDVVIEPRPCIDYLRGFTPTPVTQ